ncbi:MULTISPECIES: hypothetical protein [Empedobacter]|uniref:hypothetical protein n=1 Tax=Empedobacter TaxID=59734 RepID=UPI001C564DDE|nr:MULTISPECIES: hypothetical protein [Empedobacter]MBW1619534.1 hypothetical protein [Empedobacter falsenii]
MENNNLNQSLIEVRKAYRILFDYQSRILDLISYISGKTQFNYNGGYSKFSNTGPRDGKGKLNFWAWDWLNFYYYEFHFNRIEIGKDEYIFSIFHLADDGFFDAHNKKGNCNKIDLNDFTDEEESRSKLIFVLGKNKWYDWGFNWNSTKFTLSESDFIKDNENQAILFKSYNLNRFDTEENTINVIEDFKKFCEGNEMVFNINLKLF